MDRMSWVYPHLSKVCCSGRRISEERDHGLLGEDFTLADCAHQSAFLFELVS